MNLDEASGYLYLSNLQIVPDTAKFMQLVRDKKNPPLLVSLTIPALKITGVKTPAALLGKKLNGRKLEISNASVLFYYAEAHPDTSSDNIAVKQALYQQLLGDLKEIQADTVEVTHVSFAFVNILSNKKIVEGSDISVHLQDVLIDSLHSNDSSRFFFAKQVQAEGGKALVKNKAGTYFYTFQGFSFNNEGGLLSVQSVQIEPQLSEDRFAAFSKFQNDRFNVRLQRLSLQQVNLKRLMLQQIVAERLEIETADCRIYRDRSYPRDQRNRVGQFPQQLLMKMPLTVSIKKLVVKDAFIEYKEKNPKSDYSGRVQFTHAHAIISNISNDAVQIKSDNHCVLDFNGQFLDMAPAQIRLNMFLNDPRGRFLYSGSMNGFEAGKLNGLIEPMVLAKIEKGRVNKLNFNFAGHNHGSDGTVTLLYDDLKLTLLKKDSTDGKLEKKKLASFVANIIVKNANPQRNQPVRVATVHYERNTNFSFFNLMWKSVFAGVKQTAGM